ncbi:LysR family transcriptional regulator [Alteraurantiacibacter aquimixticola]|uniref:LysR family transcriptional regulator n=1 Tax=Alteraurantiacibacter aquimixticola TaxID=2489173 RepID=A0A4V4U8V0_9SPHN|nr:LysR family transcriptional regulator [Alteraurantiacibacter aquimixticola]TIX51477.1 LysR family transcriptional regulator [Alteraurantiacibacter aquimixticola]
MDTLANIRTFLAAARLGSFAAAARSQGIAPSVVSKRISQLEDEFKVTLFHRSTREIALTVDGNRMLPHCEKLLFQFDELRDVRPDRKVGGHLRIDAPGTVTSRIFGPLFSEFLAIHPDVDMDLRLIDRLTDQFDQDCDITIGTRPSRSAQINDFPLMPYSNATYASPEYIAAHGEPKHPDELAKHTCLVSLLYGNTWHFYGDAGDFAITVQPRLQVNDAIILREAVRQGLGLAVLPSILVEEDLRTGRLKRLLPDFRPPPLWLKALVPSHKLLKPNVRTLLDFLHERLSPNDSGSDRQWLTRVALDEDLAFSPSVRERT